MLPTKNEQRRALRNLTQRRIYTPIVPVAFPALGTPQKGGEYDGVYGKYKLTLVLDTAVPAQAALIDELKDRYDFALKQNPDADTNPFPVREQKSKAKYVPGYKLQPGEDEDTKVLTGKMELTITEKGGYMNDSREDVLTELKICGADNVQLTKTQKDALGGGSTMELVLNTYAYYEAKKAGLSIRFVAIKVHEERANGGTQSFDELFGSVLGDTEGSF